MGLPSELSPASRPNRIQGTAFAGPDPEALLSDIRKKRQQEQEAQNSRSSPSPVRISQAEASRIQREQEKALANQKKEYGAQTERTLNTAGVAHIKTDTGLTEPKVTSDTRGVPSLEWGSGETPNELGGLTKYDQYGTPKQTTEPQIKIAKGDASRGEDPNSLYRVFMGRSQVDGATPERDATRKSKRIGGIDELSQSDDESIRQVAIPAKNERDKALYDEAFKGFQANAESIRAEMADIKTKKDMLENTTELPPENATDEQKKRVLQQTGNPKGRSS